MAEPIVVLTARTRLNAESLIDLIRDAMTGSGRSARVQRDVWELTYEDDTDPALLVFTLQNGKHAGLELHTQVRANDETGGSQLDLAHGGNTRGLFLRFLDVVRRETDELEIRLLRADSEVEIIGAGGHRR